MSLNMRLGFRRLAITIIIGLNSCIYSSEGAATKKKQILALPQAEDQQDKQEKKQSCCQRMSGIVGTLCTVCVLVLGAKFQAEEQKQLTAICENPASVNGFQLSSRMQVPLLKPAAGPDECECWKPNLVICGEQSHTRISLLYSTTYRAPLAICRDREKEPIPLLHDQGRTELYDKAITYGAQNSKHVLYWQEHPCGMWPKIKNIFKKD